MDASSASIAIEVGRDDGAGEPRNTTAAPSCDRWPPTHPVIFHSRSPTTTSAPAVRKAAARSSSRRTMARTGSRRWRSRLVKVSPDPPELAGRTGNEDRSVIGHATSLRFAEL